MNGSSNGRASVYVTDNPSGVACVRVIGQIDVAIASALDAALTGITAVPRPAVYIDLAGVGLADSTLVNFLCRLIDGMPCTPVLLCRPQHLTRMLIELCQLQYFATITASLPAEFSFARSHETQESQSLP
jgi:anti-anti-sigma regulatory factor